jgi:acyl carrier protein
MPSNRDHSAAQAQEQWRAETLRPDDLRDWLIQHVAEVLDVPPQEIEANQPLTSYGLGSLQALVLVSELEAYVGRDLSSTLFWDCLTLNEVIKHLTDKDV